MLAYSFMLIILVFVDAIIKQGITTRVAIAAALASYFFSFADLLAVAAERTAFIIGILKSNTEIITEIVAAWGKQSKQWGEIRTVLESAVSGITGEKTTSSFDTDIGEELLLIDRIEKSIVFLQEKNEMTQAMIVKKRKAEKWFLVLSAALFFIGFFLFFMVAIFDAFSLRFAAVQNAISICAFAVVIQCYEAKERNSVSNEKDEQNARDVNRHAEELKRLFEEKPNIERLSAAIASLQESSN